MRVFLRIIKRLNTLLNKEPNFTINNVELISGKSPGYRQTISDLEEKLIETLYNHYLNETEPDFDFCHKDFEKYRNASYYIISDGTDKIVSEESIRIQDILKILKKEVTCYIQDFVDFKKFILLKYMIETQDDDSNVLTRGFILDHIHGEISLNANLYFLIDKKWYRVNEAFVSELNFECKQLVADAWDDKLIMSPFNHKTERDFNASFIGQQGVLVFDTITYENIEACDILKTDGKNIYLIHIKKGI